MDYKDHYFHKLDAVHFIMSFPENTIKFTKTIKMIETKYFKRSEWITVTPQKAFNRDCIFIKDRDIIGFDESQIFWRDEDLDYPDIIVKDFPYKPMFKTDDKIFDLYAGIGVWKEGYVCWIPEITAYCDGLFEKAIFDLKENDPITIRCPDSEPYMLFREIDIFPSNYKLKTLYDNNQVLPNLIYFSDTHDKVVEWQKNTRANLNV
jgi:hypothetical protein